KAVVVIDGEHYVSVVRDALATLPYEVVGVYLAGGTEKLRGGEEYGVPRVDDFEGAEIVVDLSDEPVLGPRERFRLASRVLAGGIRSEERRVGKECRVRWSADHEREKNKRDVG